MVVRRLLLSLSLFFVWVSPVLGNSSERSIVEDPNSDNTALIVGVAHGLPGIGLDVKNVKQMTEHTSYKFKPATILQNGQARIEEVKSALTEGADNAGGTFLFYFSGHGSRGSIYLQNGNMRASEIRTAIEAGRQKQGPLDRLVMFFDSCHSGSLLDPMRSLSNMAAFRGLTANEIESLETDAMVDSLYAALTPDRDGPAYWKSLFVMASSRANELSNAGSNGSAFTVGMTRAFNEAVKNKGTLEEFVTKTKLTPMGTIP
jgi:hypothetical protein